MADPPYRAPIPVPPDPYLLAWRRHLRRRVVAFAAFFLPNLGLASFALWYQRFVGPVPPAFLWVFLGSFALSAGSLVWILAGLRCPHCGNRFLTGNDRAPPPGYRRGRTCLHCGIKVGTPKSLAVPSRIAPMLRVEDDARAVAEEDVEKEAEEAARTAGRRAGA